MIKAFGPKRSKSLRDKYLPLLMIAAAFFFTLTAQGQVDTSKILQRNNTYGFEWNNGDFKGFLGVPLDSFKLKQSDSGSVAYVNRGLWLWDGEIWIPVSSGDGYSVSIGLHESSSRVFALGGNITESVNFRDTYFGMHWTVGDSTFADSVTFMNVDRGLWSAGAQDGTDSAKIEISETGDIHIISTGQLFFPLGVDFDSLSTGYVINYDPITGQVYWGTGTGGGSGGISAVTGNNGLTASSSTNLQWGGTLIQATDINQDGNAITFHGGTFDHTYLGGSIHNTNNSFYAFHSDGGNNTTQILSSNVLSGPTEPTINLTASSDDHTLGTELHVSASRITFSNPDGEYYFGAHNAGGYLKDSAQLNAVYYDPATGLITYGLAASGSGTTVLARNGTLVNGGYVELGGTTAPGAPLLHNSYISSATFSLNITGSVATNSFAVTNTNASGTGINAIAGTSGTGVQGSGGLYGLYGSTTGGAALRGVSTTGIGLQLETTSGLAARINANPSGTTDIIEIMQLNRTTSGTAANGIGEMISFQVEDAGGLFQMTNQIRSKWTTAAHATRTGEFQIWGVNSAAQIQQFTIAGTGQIVLNRYGTNSFTGTLAYVLGETSDGHVIEIDPTTLGSGTPAASDEFDPVYFDVQDRDVINPITLKTNVVAMQTDITTVNTRIDSLLNNFPTGALTSDIDAVNARLDSLLNNFPSGSLEVNTIAATITTTANRTIPSESILQYILVKPSVSLLALKVGILSDDDYYVTSTPVTAGSEFTVIDVGAYIPSSTAIYISGITSSTDIKLIYKPLHQ